MNFDLSAVDWKHVSKKRVAMYLYARVCELEIADGSSAEGARARAENVTNAFLDKFKKREKDVTIQEIDPSSSSSSDEE